MADVAVVVKEWVAFAAADGAVTEQTLYCAVVVVVALPTVKAMALDVVVEVVVECLAVVKSKLNPGLLVFLVVVVVVVVATGCFG